MFDQVHKIAWRATYSGNAKIAQYNNLPLGISAGNGNYRGSQGLGAIVQTKAAGEKPVPIGVLQYIALVQAVARQTANNSVAPHAQVVLRVSHNDRRSRGPARCMQPHHVAHLACK